MPFLGKPLIQRIADRLAGAGDELFITTNRPEDYDFLGIPVHADIHIDQSALGGLFTALRAARYPFLAAIACDMPFASPRLLKHEYQAIEQYLADAVVPATPAGLEPLHAVYRKETCLPVIEAALANNENKLIAWLPKVKTIFLQAEEIDRFDPERLAFWNLNTPEEFAQAEEKARLDPDV